MSDNKKWYDGALLVNRDADWTFRVIKGETREEMIESANAFFSKFGGHHVTDVLLNVYEQSSFIPSESIGWIGGRHGHCEGFENDAYYSVVDKLYKCCVGFGIDYVDLFLKKKEKNMDNKKWYKDALLVNRDPNWYGAIDTSSKETAEKSIEKYFSLFKGHKVTDVQLCIFENTSLIPSKSVMWRGDKFLQKKENGIAVDYSRLEGLWKCFAEYGVDAAQIFIDTMKKIGIRPWITLRMNDAHFNGDKTAFLRDDFYYIAEKNGWMIGGEYGYYSHCLDYSVPEVRARMLGLIGEILDKYDFFGLELDFMREIYCFDYRHNPDCHKIMTEFLHQVKSLVTKAEKRVDHPIRLMIRTHRSPKDALEYGFDIKTMCEEHLVDAVVPSPRWETADSAIPVSEWREVVGEDVALFPAIETLNYRFTTTTTDISKAYAAAFYAQDADGIYLYNHEYYTERNRGTWMIDRESCLKGRRDFVVTFQDIMSGSYPAYRPLPMSADGQLSLKVGHISKNNKLSVIIDFEGDVPPTISTGCVKNAEGEKMDAIVVRDHDNERDVNVTEHSAYTYDISGVECELDLVLEFAGCGIVHYVDVVIEE